MYLPKSDIYKRLKTLGYAVMQEQPQVFSDTPSIVFKVLNNNTVVDLDNEIVSQDIEVGIDIWADTSVLASEVLSQVEDIMREDIYNMTYSSDVPNEGNLFHINARFKKVV